MSKENRLAALDRAVAKAGGIVAFRKAMGLSHQSVYAWKRRGYVPFPRAAQIEAKFGIPHRELVDPAVVQALETVSATDVL